jgi:hypothetical protein
VPAAVVYLLMPARAALIAVLILDRQMCLPCIAAKALVTEARVQSVLEAIATALVLHHDTGRCVACGETTAVHSVWRPPY